MLAIIIAVVSLKRATFSTSKLDSSYLIWWEEARKDSETMNGDIYQTQTHLLSDNMIFIRQKFLNSVRLQIFVPNTVQQRIWSKE